MYLFLLVGFVGFAILAIFLRDLLKAAISLAFSSIFLAMIFFHMKAYYVGVFEISVVAGLITVLFIATIGLTKGQGDVRERKIPVLIFPVFFVAFLILDVMIMKALQTQIAVLSGKPEVPHFPQVLWGVRTLDLVGQIGVIFAGVFAVLALFRKGGSHE